MSENTLCGEDISLGNFQKKVYFCISETDYSNHEKSFNHEIHRNNAQLSNELWKIKVSKKEPVLVGKILGQYQPYSVNKKWCLICLNEKLHFAVCKRNNILNKQTEIISKRLHQNKYALKSYDSMD